MKKLFVPLIIILTLCSCAKNKIVLKDNPPATAAIAKPAQKENQRQHREFLSNVKLSAYTFNPGKGEEVAIYYTLTKKAEVELKIYDPDFSLVKTIKSNGLKEEGQQNFIWDGRDMEGKLVPDEAYFVYIQAVDEQANKEIYDPTVFSGGEQEDITQADINPEANTITYKLPQMARVLLRLGVQDGPLLYTLVDWKPRSAGEVTEYWSGKDKDNLIDLFNHPRFKVIISYFKLPENSFITYGNKNVAYSQYKKSLKAQREIKEKPARPGIKLSPHYELSRLVDYSPNLKLTFSNAKLYDKGIPVLQGKTLVKVEIDESDKTFFVNQQYEICLFLDNEFYTEQEVGYAPFNWVWDLTDVKEGEYVLTVNMSGFKDQIGVLSKKVKVVK